MSDARNIAWEAEWGVLGALMANNRCYRFLHGLSPVHFGDPINGVIFDELAAMIVRGELADALTVLPRLVELGIEIPWDTQASGNADFGTKWATYLAQLLISMSKVIDLPKRRDEIITAWERRNGFEPREVKP